MAIAVARRGAKITIATDAEVTEVRGTSTYAVTFRMGGKLVTGTFDRGNNAPLNAYRLGYSAFDITYKVGLLGRLYAVAITIGPNGTYPLKRQ